MFAALFSLFSSFLSSVFVIIEEEVEDFDEIFDDTPLGDFFDEFLSL